MLLHALLKRLDYANVTSTACLFVVLGGSAYAAASITGKDVRNGSLTSADIKDHSLRARDFKASALRTGPPGPKGEPGRDGAPAPSVQALPPASRQPAGRLTLSGVTGSGPGGTIQVRSVAWSNVTSAWGELIVAKAPDRSSPELWKRTATGQHLAAAKLELLAQGANAPYATYAFDDVTVTAFSTRGSGDERRDEVRLRFAPDPVLTFDPSAPLAPLTEPQVGEMIVDGIPGTTRLVLDAWNVANTPDPYGGGGVTPAQFGPFLVSAGIGAASPAHLQRFAAGQHIESVTIRLLQPGSSSVYTTFVLGDVVIASYAVVGDARPLERIGFDAARIESTTPVAGGEPIHACYDRKLMAPCA